MSTDDRVETACLDGQRQPADRLLPTAWGLPSSSATGAMGTACYKGYEPCTSAPWSRIRNISIDSQKSKLEMYASNESSAKRSFPSDSLLPIKVEVHWVHNLKVAGYQEAAQAIEGAENRGIRVPVGLTMANASSVSEKETNPDRALTMT
ncbi:hypothetical protein NUH16_006309 [Penicillium rubens]|nr:hypothetical protein NUH16_006309 [Penicillium rubens]